MESRGCRAALVLHRNVVGLVLVPYVPEIPTMRTFLSGLLLCFVSLTSLAEPLRIEVIPVNGRDISALIRTLRPLIPPPGTLAGYEGKLVIKTTPSNLREIRQVLGELDRPLKNLLVTVRRSSLTDALRQDDNASLQHRSGNIVIQTGDPRPREGATVILGDENSRARINALTTRRKTQRDGDQRIRVLEGRPAFITVGEETPTASRNVVITRNGRAVVQDSVDYRRAQRGFFVRARLARGHVLVDVASADSRARPDGVFEHANAYTTFSGLLGEWLEIGGVSESATRSGSRTLQSTRTVTSSDSQILVRVELTQ